MNSNAIAVFLPSGMTEAVKSRRSVRAFRDDPVDGAMIAELLDAARWAPSPHNSQPWRFTILTQGRDKLALASAMAGRLALELEADGLDAHSIKRQTGRSVERIATAPAVIVCSLVPDGLVTYPDSRRAELEWQMAVQSVGCVLQTLFLVAAERGIATCWMAAPMYCPEEVRAALSLDPHYEPQALVLLGYAATEGKIRERRPLDVVVDIR